MRSRWLVPGCVAFALCLLPATTGRPAPPAPDMAAVAKRLWASTDVVLDRHVRPPTRQELFLGAAEALYQTADLPIPADLSRRLSALATEEQVAAFFQEIRNSVASAKVAADADLQSKLLAGLLRKVPGGAHVIPAEQVKGLERIENNRYEGTGIQIRYHDDEKYPQIVIPFRNGPMHRAGARPGDLIVEVDGQSMHGVPLREVVKALAGDKGTKVTVVVRQPGAAETRALDITRDVIPFTHVVGYRPGPDGTWQHRVAPSSEVGYLRLDALTMSALHELRQAERRLQAEGAKTVVLDLRFNGGGTLPAATQVADGLLDGGVLWRVRDRQGPAREVRADRDCLFRDLPLVVLVNGGTGSAAVLLAAALQDNGRAVVVGETTQAAGYVRSRVPLPGGDLLELPTAFVERAKPSRAAAFGEDDTPRALGWTVQPDHAVTLTVKQRDGLLEWFRQKDLPEPPADARAPDDPQLARAVELLEAALKKTEPAEKPR
jgi:C-terminal peptidase prc